MILFICELIRFFECEPELCGVKKIFRPEQMLLAIGVL